MGTENPHVDDKPISIDSFLAAAGLPPLDQLSVVPRPDGGKRCPPYLRYLRGLILTQPPEFWDELLRILTILNTRLNFKVEPSIQVVMAVLAINHKLNSIAELFSMSTDTIDSSIHGVIAVSQLVLDTELQMPPHSITPEIQRRQKIFSRVLDQRMGVVNEIMADAELSVKLQSHPSLQLLVDRWSQTGEIASLLAELGLEFMSTDKSINHRFRQILNTGEVVGGILNLLRRVTYTMWLSSENLGDNLLGLDTAKIGGALTSWALNPAHKISKKSQRKYVFRKELRNFIRYVYICELQRQLTNESFNTDWICVSWMMSNSPKVYSPQMLSLTILPGQITQLRFEQLLERGFGTDSDRKLSITVDLAHYTLDNPLSLNRTFIKFVGDVKDARFQREIATEMSGVLQIDRTMRPYEAGLTAADLIIAGNGVGPYTWRKSDPKSPVVLAFQALKEVGTLRSAVNSEEI